MENSTIYQTIKEDFNREAEKSDGIFSKNLTECDRLAIDFLANYVNPWKKILEIGCGKGNVIENISLESLSNTVYCMDISEGMLKECKIENKQIGNMDDLPYEDGFFDLVYMIMTLQQSQNKKKTLSEMERVTKKGGTMVIIDGDKDSGIGQERERQIKAGTWKMVGKADWISAKDFPNWEVSHLKDHIICLKKTIGQ